MRQMFGGPGKISGLVLRIFRCIFAAVSVSISFSAPGLTEVTPFRVLLIQQCVETTWSFVLVCCDLKVVVFQGNLPSHFHVMVTLVIDWVVLTLSLGAISSAVAVIHLIATNSICYKEHEYICRRYMLSVGMDFIAMVFHAISALVLSWIVASSILPRAV
ncbi:unnamed protein product [Cuscuta epithymum]|uniref:CASP-like protein n=1 Tax=Cuscuta epithymum TaxID=186058 RepID=A0AAV0ETA5_9ASTE|nr:unnamed protein product [Cuscuta epithymum]